MGYIESMADGPIWRFRLATEKHSGEKIDKDAVYKMNDNIDHMVARYIILAKEIIHSKADVGNRASRRRALYPCGNHVLNCQIGHPDMDVVLDVVKIIEYERDVQRVRIEEATDDGYDDDCCDVMFHEEDGVPSSGFDCFSRATYCQLLTVLCLLSSDLCPTAVTIQSIL